MAKINPSIPGFQTDHRPRISKNRTTNTFENDQEKITAKSGNPSSVSARLGMCILVLGMLLGTALFLWQISANNMILHDDAISYLAATCHQAAYATSAPSSKWVTVGEWKSFFYPEKFWSFKIIGNELAEYDIHPPLYFWLLHIWFHLFDVSAISGPAMNLPLLLFATLMIYRLCRRLECNPEVSATASTLWLLSSPTLVAAREARPYVLLAVMVIGVVMSLIRFMEKRTLKTALIFACAALASVLTHYHSVIILTLAAAIAAIILLVSRRWKALILLGFSSLVSAIAFFTIHPHFAKSFERLERQTHVFNVTEAESRIGPSVFELLNTLLPYKLSAGISQWISDKWQLCFLVMGAVAIGIFLFIIMRRHRRRLVVNIRSVPFVLGVTALSCIWALYIGCVSPRHAMGAKYMMLVTPLLFVGIGQVLNRFVGKAYTWIVLILLLITFQTLQSGILTKNYVENMAKRNKPIQMNSDSPIIAGTVSRGILPSLLWHARDESMVYANKQKNLLDDFPELPDSPQIIFLSHLSYGNTTQELDRIVTEFAKRGYRVSHPRPYSVYGHGILINLQKIK